MNVYEWMGATESEPPLHEDDSREDPGHRPQVPTEDGDDTNRQHHGDSSPAGGGRSTSDDDEMHCTEHTIQDPHMFEDMTSSNESIVEDVRKFFKFHNRGKDFQALDGDAKADIGKIFRTIEHTFADKTWIDKQTPITGEIKVGDLADRLNLSKPVDTIKETAAINDSFQEAVISAQLTTVKQLLPVLKLWSGKLTDTAYEKTKAALSSVKSMPEIVKKPTRAKTNLLDGKTSDAMQAPLTPEETVELAGVILSTMKVDAGRVGAANQEISNLLGDFWEAVSDIRREGAHSESYNNEAWDALSQAVFRKLPASIPESMAVFRQFEAACIAAVVYMERSFKGGKKVSNEEVTVSTEDTVSNEGFMDSIKKLFAAKPDGLDVKSIDLRLKKEFEKTILNDTWLKSQKLKSGKVTVRFPDAAMDGNYKPLVAKIKQELQSTAATNKKASDKWYNKIAQGVDLICSGNVKGANLEHVQKLNKLVVYDDLDFKIAYSEPTVITEDDAEVELDALDITGIKEAGKAILDLLDARNKYVTESFGSMPLRVTDERLHLIAKVDGEVKEELHKLRMEVEDIQDYFVESFYQDQYAYYKLVDGLAMPLARWIQQSISGVTVSKEDFGSLGKH